MRKIALVLLLIGPVSLFAEEKPDYAAKARLAMTAFECYWYAVHADKKSEAEKLFVVGYANAKEFVSAKYQGLLSDEFLTEQITMQTYETLSGTSEEFSIGRMFQAKADQVLDEVTGENNSKMFAGMKYINANCAVIGSLK
jgi:hypothetical protein